MAENPDELRLYVVVRTDLGMAPLRLVEIAAQAAWRGLDCSRRAGDPRYLAYDEQQQPKIGLRVKTADHLARALDESLRAGIPAGVAFAAPGVPAAVGIGPVLRHELPLFVAKLQLLGDVAPVGIADASLPLPSDPAVWILVRRDAAIPYGKLVAQAGHGLWAPVAKGLRRKPGAIHAWNDAGAAVAAAWVGDLDAMTHAHEAAISDGLASGFIVDEGRTVFAGRPTPTVVGIGPCHRADLPAEVLAAFERRVLRTDQDFAQHPTI